MCGILGIINFGKGGGGDLSGRYLSNRGPDARNSFKDGPVRFLHCRLAIIDQKETSRQPIETADYCLIANAEIYNYDEIKKEGGYRYSGTSDCESIIHAYDRYGIDGFKRLDGAFVFALYDKRNRKVFVCRDSIGKKPLYFFYKQNEEFIFSSNVTAIADNYPGRFAVNALQVKAYFNDGVVSPAESFLERVVPVLPGEIYEIDLGSNMVTLKTIQKPCTDYSGFDYSDQKSVQTVINNLLEKAVLKRVKNVSRPVLLLSGGIDSTVLAHYLLAANPDTELVSLSQPFGFLYDQPYIRQASRILGKKVHFVEIHKGFLRDHIDKLIAVPDQPLAVYSYYFLSALALKAREFGRVLFTGDGGDEAFLGYGRVQDWFGGGSTHSNNRRIHSGPALPSCYSDYAFQATGLDLIGHGFLKVDKAISENQLEARCPFLDWELLCFLRSIPAGYWLGNGVTKFPLKQILLSAGFPDSFVSRKKAGFFYPFKYVMIPQLGAMKDYLCRDRGAAGSLSAPDSCPSSVIKLFRRFDHYWKLLVFLKFKEAHKDLF